MYGGARTSWVKVNLPVDAGVAEIIFVLNSELLLSCLGTPKAQPRMVCKIQLTLLPGPTSSNTASSRSRSKNGGVS